MCHTEWNLRSQMYVSRKPQKASAYFPKQPTEIHRQKSTHPRPPLTHTHPHTHCRSLNFPFQLHAILLLRLFSSRFPFDVLDIFIIRVFKHENMMIQLICFCSTSSSPARPSIRPLLGFSIFFSFPSNKYQRFRRAASCLNFLRLCKVDDDNEIWLRLGLDTDHFESEDSARLLFIAFWGSFGVHQKKVEASVSLAVAIDANSTSHGAIISLL